jgi:glycosyltransferase involved in cell wall biosynthesis
MKTKLMFLVNVDWFFVSHRLPIALAAIAEGYEVHLACQFTGHETELAAHGIVLHSLSLSRSGIGLFAELKSFMQMARVIRKVKPDLLHLVTIKPALYGGVIGRLLRVPGRIISVSGLGYIFISQTLKARLLRPLIAFSYKIALKHESTKVIFQNPDDQALLERVGAIRSEQGVLIRGSGVDVEHYQMQPEPLGIPVVLLVARLLKDKGVYEFVDAAKKLHQQNFPVRMVLVGEPDPGNPNTVEEAAITQWVTAGTVEYWGFRENINMTIAESNLMVLPSYREGLPKSLLEAAACGRAVITTDVPGCRDAIENNVTGILVPVRNSEQLAEAIKQMCTNEQRRYEMAAAGRQLALREFDIRKVVAIHLHLYQRLEKQI